MSLMKKKKCLTALLLGVSMALSYPGCAKETAQTAGNPGDVPLIEPVGVGESYELVVRRNLYEAKILNGLVSPYTEEYKLKNPQFFDEYLALPGDYVKKGETIIRTETENLDKQIEEMEKQIAGDAESYQEYLQDNGESLEKLRKEEESWGEVVARWEKEKPEEFVTAEDENGEPVSQRNPEYASWAGEMQFYESRYRNALIGRQELEAAMEQREELYQLDSGHNRVLLNRLKKQRSESTLTAGMNGYVANIRFLNKGNYMASDVAMVAVADMDRKVLKTEFVNQADIAAAKQVFAVIDGKRYEVEYEPMDNAEYKQLEDENGKVFATFYLPEELKDVEVGTYGVVVVVRSAVPNTLTVSRKAVLRGVEESYVYVLRENGERVYTPVKTGMQDGLYVEILSGLEEGDRVLSEAEQPTGNTMQALEKGSVSKSFSQNATLAYVRQDWVENPVKYGTAYLVEYNMNIFQQVKKGDVLVKIRVVGDEIELARQEKVIARERERLEVFKKEVEKETDKDAIKANNKSIQNQEKAIAELEKKLAELKADYAVTEIKAPHDGVITRLTQDYWSGKLKEGMLLEPGYAFGLLSPLNSNYLAVTDAGGILTYGNRAKVNYTSLDGSMKSTEGEVVTLNPYVVSKALFEEASGYSNEGPYALVRLSPEVMGDMASSFVNNNGYWSESVYKVTVSARSMDNVLLVPKRAVMSYGGATYVKIKTADGTVMYQSFLAGGSDSENYWVVDGLTEGMEICIE